MAYIEFKNVVKAYQMGEVFIQALDNTNFEIEKGELTVVVGPSGAGKTTALNILGGMDLATKGRVIIDNKEISSLKEKELIKYRREDIGFVFQFYNLVQNLTALENVELATQICKNPLDPKAILKKVGLEERMNNFPSQLSGGEQQRTAVARAISQRPSILFADEPTGNLDKKTSEELLDFLLKLHRKYDLTILLVTHDLDIARCGDEILLLEDGCLKTVMKADEK